MGAEFARDRPKIAERLLLNQETGASLDPHVERLIEGFAFLTARIRLKLDDEFPELTESLLETLYPHYLAPIPSMAIIEFDVDAERGNLPEGHTIERGSNLHTQEFDGVRCQYRTTTPVTLRPVGSVSSFTTSELTSRVTFGRSSRGRTPMTSASALAWTRHG